MTETEWDKLRPTLTNILTEIFSIQSKLNELEAELAEVKKAAMMTDHEKQVLVWANFTPEPPPDERDILEALRQIDERNHYGVGISLLNKASDDDMVVLDD